MRNRILSSARARFAATAATVFALVALGGVAATPAYADGTVNISVTDASTGGAPYAGSNIYVGPAVVFLSGGSQSFPLAAGSYTVSPIDTSYFNANTPVTVVDGETAVISVEFDKYHATGSIPGDGGTDVVVSVEYQSGTFTPTGSTQTIASGVSTFDVRVPYGPGTYRLKFEPADGSAYLDTYSAPFTITGASPTQAIGHTVFGIPGTISGTVVSNADSSPVTTATVYVEQDGTVLDSSTVAPDGSYTLNFGASSDIDVVVRASAPGFVDLYYDGAGTSGHANTVSLTSANSYSASAINFSMVVDLATASGNLTQYGGGNVPSPADIYLYKFDSGANAYLATPYETAPGSASFSFADLPDGSYRLAFRDPATDKLLTWQLRDRYGATVYANDPQGYGQCALDFGISGGADVQLVDIEVVGQAFAGYCSGPPYGSGTDKIVTGTVLNPAVLSPTVYAKLYQVGSGGISTLIDLSAVNSSTGEYSLGGVREDGEYYILFSPDAGSAVLPTLLGDAGASEWARDDATIDDFAASDSFTVDIADDLTLSDHDVTLTEGSLVTGTMLTEFGDAVHGQVVFTAVGDSTPTLTVVGNGDGWGTWSAVLPVGGSYTMRAEALVGTYVSEYWQDETRLVDADPIGPLTAGAFGDYEFRLADDPPVISGDVADASDPDPITVHLFFKDEFDLWRVVDEQVATGGSYSFDLNYDTGVNDGLVEGDYRLRFEDSNGVWLAATDYETGLLPSTWNGTVTGPACFVDITVESGPETAVNANFDIANQTEVCAAEPAVEGDVTGSFVWNGTVPMSNREIELFSLDTYTPIEITTDSDGNFTFPDVTNGDYALSLYPDDYEHVNGEHEYEYYAEFTFTGGADLGELAPLRYGNITATFSDWDNDTMAGATASVFAPCGCADSWDYSAPWITVEIDEFGHFEVPGVGLAGQYSVFIEPAGTEFVPQFVLGGLLEPDAPFTGVAETDYDYGTITLNPVDYVSITGTVMFGSIPGDEGEVIAWPADGSPYAFSAEVQSDGSYELLVAPNIDYQVFAVVSGLIPQIYDGVNFDFSTDPFGVGTPVEVDEDPVGGIDFSLIAPDGIVFDLFVAESYGGMGGSISLNNVDTHLYKYVNDGWEEVDVQNADDYVTLFASGDGDYRLRFSRNGEWLSIDQTDWEISLPPYEEGGDYESIDACYIDFDDLLDGSDVDGTMLLDSDPTLHNCGPELLAEHYDVVGSTVQTGTFVNAPVVGQTVTLTNGSGMVITTTTDSNGDYLLDGVSPGTYTLEVPTMVLASDGHAYVSQSQTVVVDDDEALDPIELTRYGNAEVTIDNWDASMAGAVAHLEIESTPGVWTPIGLSDAVDAGLFVIPGFAENGDYRIWIDYPAGFVDGYARDYLAPTVVAEYAGTAEYDLGGLVAQAFTTVSGTVSLGSTALAGADVTLNSWAGSYDFTAVSDAAGAYTIAVPAGGTYTVYGEKSGLVRDVITTQNVAFAPQSGVDLSLQYATFFTGVYADPVTPLATATVHLYRQVSGGWEEVDSDTGALTLLAGSQGGSYRIRISDGADWLAISSFSWLSSFNPADVHYGYPNPNACFIDFGAAYGGSEYDTGVYVNAASSVECAAEPAVVTPTLPPVPPGTGKGKTAAATDEEVVTEEVVPTSTPTPGPEPSEDATQEPTDETVVDKPEVASTPDLTWLFWLSGILVLVLLGGGAVYFIRRR